MSEIIKKSTKAPYAIVKLKCWDGEYYFVKSLKTCRIKHKSATIEEAESHMEKYKR